MSEHVKDGAPAAMVRSKASRVPVVQDAQGNISPSQLIMAALDRGVDPDALGKLVALQERMEARNAAKEFSQALARFKAKCPTIYKDKKITVTRKDGGSYSFMTAPLDRIAEAVDGPLAEEGFSYYWDRKMENGLMHSMCTLEHLNGHTRTSTFPIPTASSNPGMSDQQKFAGAATFADRKAFAAVLGIVAADEGEEEAAREVDPTPITADQATFLEDRIKEVGANRKKFLAHFEIESIEKLPAACYTEAVTALDQVEARKKENAK